MALTKVSGGILDPGINVAGIVTATGFDGPFTGGSSKNINAGIITATGFDLNGNGDISGNLVIGGNLTANGDFTTLNTTLREVELLRVDAQNDNVAAGIITQRGSGDILNLFDTNTEVFTVKDGGNVGINSTSPREKLDVIGNANIIVDNNKGIKLGYRGENKTAYIGLDANDNANAGTQSWANSAYIGFYSDGSSERSIKYRANAGSHIFQGTNGDEFARITSAGKVGIGTDNPAHHLHLVGTDANLQFRVTKGGVGSFNHGVDSSGAFLETLSSDNIPIRFFAGGSARVRIHPTGQVTIGAIAATTTKSGILHTKVSNTTSPVVFENDTENADVVIRTTGTNKHSMLGFGDGADNFIGNIDYDHQNNNMVFDTSGGERLRIGSGGIVTQKETGTGNGQGGIRASTASAGGNAGFGFITDGSQRFSVVTIGSAGNEALRIYDVNNSAERLRINSDGDVLVGTATTPTADIKLLVSGNGGVSSGSYFSFRADYGNVPEPAAYAIKYDSSLTNLSGAGGLHQYAYGGIAFNLGGQDRVNFTTTGKVLVGSGCTDASTFNVKGSAGFADDGTNAGIIIATDDANGAGIHCVTTGGFANGGYGIMRFNASQHKFTYGNTQRLLINASGKAIFSEEIETPQDYPNYRPTLNFNFAAEKKLEPRIIYERTGSASFVNEFGKVVLVGDNAPRFDHHPDTKESLGLLIEPKKTNLWLYSEDLVTYVVNAEMQQSALSNTTATTDPTGGTNAVLMAATATSGVHSFYKYFSSGSNGDVHTASVWVKAAGVDYARLYVDTVGGNMGGPGVTFSTGNTWNVTASGTATQAATSVVKYPNGWWRLSVSGSFSNQNAYYVHIDLEGGEGDVSFTGNGSDGMYVWGVQFESSTQSNVTSYIPTYGTAVTRGDDIVKLDGEDFTDFYNQEEGTLVSEFKIFDRIQSSAAIANINALSSSSYADSIMFMEVGHTSGYFGRVYKNSNGLNLNGSSDQSSIVQNGNQTNKVSFGWSATSVNQGLAAYLNGTLQEESTDESRTPTNMTELRIGTGWQQNSAENQTWTIHAHIKKLMYYPKRLSNNQLATLTS